MKVAVKRMLQRAGAYEQVSSRWIWLSPRLTRVIRAVNGRNQRLIRRYLAAHPVAKLHIGCGANALPGWLNTELDPKGDQIYLDATKPFPLPDNTFEFIYSEHMIEHIPYADALDMVRECFRVLRPGGTIRLVTPDLAFLRALIDGPPDPRYAAYFEFYRRHNNFTGPQSPTHFFNYFVRSWGHQFIYDREALHALLSNAGFDDIETCALSESPNPLLRGLAKTGRMPDGMLAMESLAMEARKP